MRPVSSTFFQLLCFVQGKGDGFFDDHMKAVIEGHHGWSEVGEVGGNDGYKVDAFISGKLAFFLIISS